MTGTLEVHLYGRHVADLLDAGDGYCALRYTEAAVTVGAPARLSLALVVRREPHPALRGAHRWAASLLPEGPALDALVAQWGVAADDVFGLLAVVGRDVAGAVVIAEPGTDPALPDARYEPLDTSDLAAMVDDLRQHPLGLDRKRGVRLSLAGLQDKLLLHRMDGDAERFARPIGGAPSTVIVKPEPSGDHQRVAMAGLATNELLGLTLADVVGLDAATACVREIAGRPCLIVERYDRVLRGSGRPDRIHQEDVLAALGRDHRHKYQRAGWQRTTPAGGFAPPDGRYLEDPGPSLLEIADLLTLHLGAVARLRLVDVLTFQVVLGNADAHARNYSLLLRRDGSVALAPLYDLVATRVFPALDTVAAQTVNGIDDIDDITLDDVEAEARTWGLPEGLAHRRAAAMARAMSDGLDVAGRRAIERGGAADIVDRVSVQVRARAARFLDRR